MNRRGFFALIATVVCAPAMPTSPRTKHYKLYKNLVPLETEVVIGEDAFHVWSDQVYINGCALND